MRPMRIARRGMLVAALLLGWAAPAAAADSAYTTHDYETC